VQLVELVKLGVAGFVAAMAVLSHKLMTQELAKPSRNMKVFDQIQKFARYTLVLSLVVLLGTVVDGVAKWLVRREETRGQVLGAEALACRQALTGLRGAEGEQPTIEGLKQVQRRAYDACFPSLSAMQQLADREP
jgi:hypothetical protein